MGEKEWAQETSTFVEIKDAAMVLLKRCVALPPHLGGILVVGEREGLQVLVYGFVPGTLLDG